MKIKSIIVSLIVCFSLNSFSQTEKLQAMFIYQFTKYFEWPASKKSGDFVIGVLGSGEIVNQLNTLLASKSVGSQKIVVKTYGSAAEVSSCNILFVTSKKNSELATAASKAGIGVLLISDSPGMAQKGSAINFVVQNNNQRFELNKANATSKGLSISSDIEKLAIIVN